MSQTDESRAIAKVIDYCKENKPKKLLLNEFRSLIARKKYYNLLYVIVFIDNANIAISEGDFFHVMKNFNSYYNTDTCKYPIITSKIVLSSLLEYIPYARACGSIILIRHVYFITSNNMKNHDFLK